MSTGTWLNRQLSGWRHCTTSFSLRTSSSPFSSWLNLFVSSRYAASSMPRKQFFLGFLLSAFVFIPKSSCITDSSSCEPCLYSSISSVGWIASLTLDLDRFSWKWKIGAVVCSENRAGDVAEFSNELIFIEKARNEFFIAFQRNPRFSFQLSSPSFSRNFSAVEAEATILNNLLTTTLCSPNALRP